MGAIVIHASSDCNIHIFLQHFACESENWAFFFCQIVKNY